MRNRNKGYADADKQDPYMMEQTGKALAALIGFLAAIAVILLAGVLIIDFKIMEYLVKRKYSTGRRDMMPNKFMVFWKINVPAGTVLLNIP